jgi:5'-nucleotidase
VSARNILVDHTYPEIAPDPALTRMTGEYAALAAPIANRQVGSITAEAAKTTAPSGESPLGDVIADAELSATHTSGKAVIAFMNEGGIRTSIPFDPGVAGLQKGAVTYGELFSAQPFGNSLTTATLSGAQLKMLLEEQFANCSAGAPAGTQPPTSDRFLQTSEGFSYTWRKSGAPCDKVDATSMRIHGVPITGHGAYRVTVNSFMAEAGDQYYVLRNGSDRVGGPQDLDAMIAYFGQGQPVTPPKPHRVTMRP